jgi:hypothetical protein
MSLILSGTDGLSDVDGSAATPAIRGTDANTGIFFPAADTIAFSEGGAEIARFDSSGNLGIGTSSPAKRLSVVNATDATTVGTNSVMTVQAGSSVNSVAEIGFSYGSWSGTNPIASLGYQITSNAGVGSGALTFSTRSVTTDTAPSERMRIDSSGNVGIGTSSPERRLDVRQSSTAGEIGAFISNTSASTTNNASSLWFGTWGSASTTGIYNAKISALNTSGGNAETALTFWTYNGSGSSSGVIERARIDSSGNLLLNTTGYNSGKIVRVDDTNDRVRSMIVNNNNSGSSSRCGYIVNAYGNSWAMEMGSSAANSNALNWTVDVFGSPVVRMALTTAGAATNSTGTWGTISDARLKENIIDASPKLGNLMQLRVVNYNLKSDPDIKMLGFVAQEIEQVFPNMVEASGDLTEDGDRYKSVKTTVLIPMLIKALQEQQAIITQLQADVAVLKGTS